MIIDWGVWSDREIEKNEIIKDLNSLHSYFGKGNTRKNKSREAKQVDFCNSKTSGSQSGFNDDDWSNGGSIVLCLRRLFGK